MKNFFYKKDKSIKMNTQNPPDPLKSQKTISFLHKNSKVLEDRITNLEKFYEEIKKSIDNIENRIDKDIIGSD